MTRDTQRGDAEIQQKMFLESSSKGSEIGGPASQYPNGGYDIYLKYPHNPPFGYIEP